ncbi:pyridoxal-phosphate dependent enzyme [Hypoxylon trugodes]|uniref:pyridoxal-phosphate dependent enzyme n=1 Tax=Hypoxylon trugodes TaxID=326681 RepID=UPI0021A14B44|nr:pyridoxal-phosphate dependent enzyme [Hypoxylon trugodes]KAI1391472.1 pyridoxal-phosphate dependent enzyme [Hypoxylon trugodes]
MGSCDPEPQKLFIETPCIPSPPLSRIAGCNVFLKLENLQPSGSFKSRGVGNMMYQAMLAKPAGNAHFYCSSGGNAGLACATAAGTLSRPCTIVVPTLTPAHMIEKMRLLGATAHQIGPNWAAADEHLRTELLAHDPAGIYVPPFDHPDVWEGASFIVDELVKQVKPLGAQSIDAILCNCGGGGLLNGIMAGVTKNLSTQTPKPKVIAVETIGAESLNASIQAGHLVTLPAITSIAISLGAPRVSERTFLWATRDAPDILQSVVVTDAEAVDSTIRFADDARMLVETACGATIAVVYNGELRKIVGAGLSDEEWSRKNVVVVVCGGQNISLEMLREYAEKFGVGR